MAVIIFCLLYLILTQLIFHMSCPFRILFGISCPGCGYTRAFLSLFHLHFREAFYYHPMILFLPIIIHVFFQTWRHKYSRFLTIETIFLTVGFLIVYAIRIAIKSDIFIFNPENGLFFEISSLILRI